MIKYSVVVQYIHVYHLHGKYSGNGDLRALKYEDANVTCFHPYTKYDIFIINYNKIKSIKLLLYMIISTDITCHEKRRKPILCTC